jgi:hypothetical protein
MSPDKKKVQKIFNQIDKLAVKGKEQVYSYYKLIDDLITKGDYNYFELTLFYNYKIDITKYSNIFDVKKKTWDEILFQTNSSISKKIKKVLDTKGVYQIGFDIYGDLIGNININVSSPLSSTYSNTSSSQLVSLTKTGNNIYLTTNDNNIYDIDIYYAKWENNTPIKNSIELLHSISPTQSSATHSSEIPTSQGGTYLIRTKMRSQSPINYRELNYKVNIERSYLLGSIVEIDRLSDDSKYYLQNKQYARLIGTKVTYLEVTKFGATSSVIINIENPQSSEETNLVNRYKVAVDYLLS